MRGNNLIDVSVQTIIPIKTDFLVELSWLYCFCTVMGIVCVRLCESWVTVFTTLTDHPGTARRERERSQVAPRQLRQL